METVYLETAYYQFMSDNVRLWMGAFKSMSVTERGTGKFRDFSIQIYQIFKISSLVCLFSCFEIQLHSV